MGRFGRGRLARSFAFVRVVVSVGLIWKRTQEARFRQPLSKSERCIFFDRAGMGLFFLDTQLGQEIENDAWLDL